MQTNNDRYLTFTPCREHQDGTSETPPPEGCAACMPFRDVTDEVAALRAQLRVADDAIVAKSQEVAALRAERDEWRGKCSEASRAMQSLQQRAERVEAEVERLLTANGMLEAVIKDTYEKRDGETCGRAQCRNATNALRAERDEARERSKGYALRMRQAESERDALRAERDDDQHSLKMLDAEVERMRPLETLLPVVQAHATSGCANPDDCLICGCYRAYRASSEQEATDADGLTQAERVERMMEAD